MSEQSFQQLAEEMRIQLNELLQDIAREPVQAAIDQIPGLFKREDWTSEQQLTAVALFQAAIVTPFVNAAVNAAQASRMSLPDFLGYVGSAWEAARDQLMRKIISEQISRKKDSTDSGVTG